MQLALKKTPQADATLIQRLSSWAIKAQLVSKYSHGGIVINGAMYHSTSARGLHRLAPGEWTPESWDIFDVEGFDEVALALFDKHQGAAYDWLSLLAFVRIRGARDASKMYCFEWCWLAMTLHVNDERVTPEMLLTWLRK